MRNRYKYFIFFFVSTMLGVFDARPAIFNFDSSGAGFNFKGGTTFRNQQPIVSYNGTFQRQSGATWSGQTIAFQDGIINDAGVQSNLTATFSPAGTVSLLGNNSLRAEPGTIVSILTAAGTNNRLEGQPLFLNDISFTDNATSLTIAVQSTLNRNIALAGGFVRLEDDLHFTDQRSFVTTGTINANGRRVTFGGKEFAFTSSLFWQNATDITLNSKVTLSSSFTFSGVNNINGNGNIVQFASGGSITVAGASTLFLTDIVFKNLQSNQILFLDSASQIRMSNMTIELDSNINTTNGGIVVEGPTTWVLKNNNWRFDQQASLTIDGITLWTDPAGQATIGGLQFGSPQANNLTLVSSGTYQRVGVGSSTDTSALQQQITNNSNAIVSQDARITQNSNAIVSTSQLVLQISNHVLANSNAIVRLDQRVTQNSSAIVSQDQRITNNSNAIVSTSQLVLQISNHVLANSNAIVRLDQRITQNSNAIVSQDARITQNSNAIVSTSLLVLQISNHVLANSNAIVRLDQRVTQNSNAIASQDLRITNNSNAIVSTSLLVLQISNHVLANSNAIGAMNALLVQTSNATVKNRSDIDALTLTVAGVSAVANAALALATNDSNAIIALDQRITNNSNAIFALSQNVLHLSDFVVANSNAIVSGAAANALSIQNSNAIVSQDQRITNNSNAIVSTSQLVLQISNHVLANSNAIVVVSNLARQNSSAIIALSQNLLHLSDFVVANSNAIVSTSQLVLQISNHVLANSNAIVVTNNLARQNSSAIIALSQNLLHLSNFVVANSNAIVVTSALPQQNSNAIVSLSQLVLQISNHVLANSNAIVSIDARVTQNSNAIVVTNILARQNSNAIIALSQQLLHLSDFVVANSNAILATSGASTNALIIQNSNAIIALSQQLLHLSDFVVANSNAILASSGATINALIIQNSNAIIALSQNALHLSNFVVANSNAIVRLDQRVTQNSNAIVSTSQLVLQISNHVLANSNAIGAMNALLVQTSNATVKNRSDIAALTVTVAGVSTTANMALGLATNDSNAIIALDQRVTNNSNAIIALSQNLIHLSNFVVANSNAIVSGSSALSVQNSNAIIVLSQRVTNNSNAIIALSQQLLHLSDFVVANSNAIASGGASNALSIQNSNAIIALSQQLLHLSDFVVANSNAIVRLDQRVTQNSNAIVANSASVSNQLSIQNSNAIISIINSIEREVDLTNTSGAVTLIRTRGVNFSVDPFNDLILTLSNGSSVFQGTSATELKITDSLVIIGQNNLIDVTHDLTINSPITFQPNAELTIQFNDQFSNATVYINSASNLILPVGSRLAFKGTGRVVFRDGFVINLYGSSAENAASFEILESANMQIQDVGKKITTMNIRGYGFVTIDSGGVIEINDYNHLVFGNAPSDNITFLVDRTGVLDVEGMAARVSFVAATFDIDFEQAGKLNIGKDGVVELNAFSGYPVPGIVSRLDFRNNGIMNLDPDGTLIIGSNINENILTVFDSTGASFRGNGVVRSLSEPGFEGRLSAQKVGPIALSAAKLVSSFVQQKDNLHVSVVFIDKNNVQKVRLFNGIIVELLPGDEVVQDNLLGFVFGTNAGNSFVINTAGNRLE
jgi:DNA primase large subunit